MSTVANELRREADASEELHPGDSEIEVMRRAADTIEGLCAALNLIASMGGKTLIAPDLGRDADEAHQIGALKAFNQAADIARDALEKENNAHPD